MTTNPINARKEELLEPFFRKLRFGMSLADVPEHIDTCVDLGCGPTSPYLRFLQSNNRIVSEYIGIDPLLDSLWMDKRRNETGIELHKVMASELAKIGDNSVDLVVGFAFLEHIETPQEVLTQVVRVLKRNGIAIFTTPTPIGKPVLEFLSMKLHIVSEREIEEHKNYFDAKNLTEMLMPHIQEGLIKVHHRYFELGFNNYLKLTKLI